MQHVNPSFNIQTAGINFETAQLFAEVGPTGVSLAVLGADNCFNAVVIYSFAATFNDAELTESLKNICSTVAITDRCHFFGRGKKKLGLPECTISNVDGPCIQVFLLCFFVERRENIIKLVTRLDDVL